MKDKLFELSKEVYEKTGWHIDDNPTREEFVSTAYTSDYLLEKLPQFLKHGIIECRLELSPSGYGSKNNVMWVACYVNDTGQYIPWLADDNNPLEALLKLTLKLHEAGKL